MRKSVLTVPSRDSRSVSTSSVENGTALASAARRALREVRHRVVARGAARRPLPHLAGAEGRLAPLGERLFEERADPSGYGSVTPVIDLRSDTATQPTPGMLAAMAAAAVGDEQMREDPTTNALQRRMAALLGQEAAIFVPTATMANQIALKLSLGPATWSSRRSTRTS